MKKDSLPLLDDYDEWRKKFESQQEKKDDMKLNADIWFKYSCIPLSLFMIIVFIIILFPLLEHSNDILSNERTSCPDTCRISLVESIPEGLLYPSDAPKHPATHQVWLDLINSATTTIEIASFYWTLKENEIYPHNSSKKGEAVFQALYEAGTAKGITINIAQSISTKENPNTDTKILAEANAAIVKNVDFPKLLGGGVLHTKFWIVDRSHFYIGSANMDWRSLTQVKELGIVGYNCSCIALDLAKIFQVYWLLGDENSEIPKSWPDNLSTVYNENNTMSINLNNISYSTYLSSSPPPLSPEGRTDDIAAILNIISSAKKFVYISVMDYFPLMLYTKNKEFWPIIDDAIRKVALEKNVKIKMLISLWKHSRPYEDYFLRSLSALNGTYPRVDIEIRRFIVPATEDQSKIPFGRVNHNKYMVTDKVAYIGTSNWSGDYFTDTAGVGFILDDSNSIEKGLNSTRMDLQKIFERDWNSKYASPLSHRV